ncbi:M23 family metallopeptidase [Paenibacillus sp. P13VS]|uniref:M23 family metallopeptidase n=1 Tax=Paenibacillus sp. P13VS TaxID=2697367 RepID=UPI00187BABDA|nr:M23 family metallopeptidase [Paenibacillus sp. P13VS]MBE7680890.1 peptidoglycan DD-metalloendopeptidase family protein [Paenibacillus sp. P13VS]
MNRNHKGSRQRSKMFIEKKRMKAEYALQKGSRRSQRSWLMLAAALGACVLLSACGATESSDQREKPSAEQTSSASPAAENTNKEETNSAEEDVMITPEHFIDTLMNGSKDDIYNQMSPELKETISLEEFKRSVDSFTEGVTSWEQVTKVKMNNLMEHSWKDQTGTKGIQAYFAEDHQIDGLLIQPLETHEETDKAFTKTQFQFPMKGEWFVFWGGNDVMSNYHYAHETQRYALDIIRTKEDLSYQGEAAVNENYYAFGEPLYAAADGTVVEVKNDIPDNTPGVMNAEEPAGNVVVIDHGNGEYSITAHLKEGSAAVKTGDKVKQGDLIGQLGNSGNSSEAHLHFQVSDGSDLFTSRSVQIRWADQSQVLTRGNTFQGLPE